MALATASIRSEFTSMMGSTFDKAQEVFESLDIDWPEKHIKIKALIEIEEKKSSHSNWLSTLPSLKRQFNSYQDWKK